MTDKIQWGPNECWGSCLDMRIKTRLVSLANYFKKITNGGENSDKEYSFNIEK